MILIVLLISFYSSIFCFHRYHGYWFQKDRPDLNGGSDKSWSYCDLKCLYLENFDKSKDFVVISFKERWKEEFSACYVKSKEQYILWNKVLQNEFYEKECGYDQKDWYNKGIKVKTIRGIGINSPLSTILNVNLL